jgi:hypothetical protein
MWDKKSVAEARRKDGRPVTLFLDIDGTLVRHFGSSTMLLKETPTLLPGVLEKFAEWDSKGYNIVLTTGRKESLREATEQQLKSLGLFWDRLILGIGGGPRYIINDLKPNSDLPTAVAINLYRDRGLEGVDLEEAALAQLKTYQ